jgi:hypothetical protein
MNSQQLNNMLMQKAYAYGGARTQQQKEDAKFLREMHAETKRLMALENKKPKRKAKPKPKEKTEAQKKLESQIRSLKRYIGQKKSLQRVPCYV